MLRICLAGDLFRHFECELHRARSSVEQLCPEFGGRELVEREIAANDGKHFAVLLEAFLLEQLLRELAARVVTLRRVDLPQPSFILPRTATNEDVFLCKLAKILGQAGAVELRNGRI